MQCLPEIIISRSKLGFSLAIVKQELIHIENIKFDIENRIKKIMTLKIILVALCRYSYRLKLGLSECVVYTN